MLLYQMFNFYNVGQTKSKTPPSDAGGPWTWFTDSQLDDISVKFP